MKNLVENRDRNLVSGLFLEDYIPSEKLWLSRYFSSEIQNRFLIYFLIFGSYMYFNRHAGYVCSMRYLKKMKKKLEYLVNLYENSKKNFDLETLSELEMGTFKLKK